MEASIVELINNVGFPIAVAVALFYLNIKTTETFQKTFSEIKDVIQSNTYTLNNLAELIKDLHKEIGG